MSLWSVTHHCLMRLRQILADRHLGFSRTYAGVDLRRILAGGKLIEKLFILVHNALPVIESANAFRSATAVIFGEIGFVFNELDLRSQIGCILKQESVSGQYFSIEWVVMRQNAVAEAKGLEERGVCSPHHVAVDVRIRIAVKLFDVLNAVNMPQESHPFTGVVLKVINKS